MQVWVTHVTPLHTKKLIGFTSLGACIFMEAVRCSENLQFNPHEGAFYASIMARAEVFISKALPLPGIIPSSAMSGASNLTDVGACVAVRSVLQVILGCFVPMAVLFAEESLSRNAFEGLATGHAKHLPPPTVLHLLHLLLVPFQGAIAFQATVCVLNLLGSWANNNSSAISIVMPICNST